MLNVLSKVDPPSSHVDPTSQKEMNGHDVKITEPSSLGKQPPRKLTEEQKKTLRDMRELIRRQLEEADALT